MHLQTKALDCLYLNWAVPLEAAPVLPEPLRYEVHRWQERDYVFASALLFRLSGLHLTALPFLRISYPQMNFRLYVLDGDGVPSVLFCRMLVPPWIAPLSRLLARQPATAAWFSYPAPSDDPRRSSWSWSINRLKSFAVTARLGAPELGPGPRLGSWEKTVDYFSQRPRGYALWESRLRSVKASHPRVDVWPLAVEVKDLALLNDTLEGVDDALWRQPHSAWLCPEIPFIFELGKPLQLPLAPQGVPAARGC